MEPGFRALADAVMESRAVLDMTQEQLAKEAKVSLDTVYNIESARDRDYRPTTRRKIEKALQWATGDWERALSGADVKPISAGPDVSSLSKEEHELVNLSLEEMAERAAFVARVEQSPEAGDRLMRAMLDGRQKALAKLKSSSEATDRDIV